MLSREKTSLTIKIILTLLAVSVLGVSPRPLAAVVELRGARLALETNDFRGAASGLALAASRQPWRSELWAQAGRLAYAGRDFRSAISYLSRAGSLSLADLLLLGDAFAHANRLERAVQTWEEALRRYGDSPEIYRRLLQAQNVRGDYTAAITTLQTLRLLSPGDAQNSYRLGLLLAANQPEAALVYLIQAAALDPALAAPAKKLQLSIESARFAAEPAYTFTAAGQTLASMGEWLLAAQAFEHAIQARPDYVEAWAFLGEARQHIGAEALPALQTAIRLDPDSVSANIILGLYHQRQGEYTLALPYIRHAAELEPDNPLWQVELGNTLAAQGDLPAAQAAYQQATLLRPKEALYWRLLADFCLQRQIQIRAVALPAARQAVLLAPNDPQSLDSMGQALLSLDDPYNAERFLRRAIQVQPSYAPAYLHLGQLYLLQGDLANASRVLQQAAALPADTAIRTQANRLLEQHFP